MNIKSRKSYALIMLAFLISIYIALAMVMETAVMLFGRDSAREVRSAKAYYFASSGARYAGALIARAPTPTFSLPTNGNTTAPLLGTELGGTFFNDIQLDPGMQLSITIKDDQTTPATYEVTSDCTY